MFPSASLLQLVLISLLAHIALAGARVTTSLYALSLNASEFTIGTLIALFALFPMLCAVTTGRLIDRIGIARPMAAGATTMALGCSLPALIGGLPALYSAAALIGTGFMVIQIAAQNAIGAMSTADMRATHFSWLGIGFSISGFCGPVIAGLLIDHASYASAYLAFCLFAGLALCLIASQRIRGVAALVSMPDHNDRINASSALSLLGEPRMRRIYIVGVLLGASWDLFTFVIPLRGAQLGFAAATIGVILGSFSAATLVVRLAMPWLVRYFSHWQVLLGALVLAAICYAAFPFMQMPLTFMIGAAILGLAVGSSQPNMLALLHQTAPPGRSGEAVGMRVTMGNACQVSLPLAFGAAGAALGLGIVFGGMTLLLAAGVPIAWHQAKKPGFRRAPQNS